MKRKGIPILVGLLLTFFASHAQVEICDNGIDDDGDTFIDIADPDCAEFYGLTFLGENADCSVDPPDSGIDFFSLGEAPIKSSQNTVDDQSKIVVGDVDNDGIPDAVATTRWGFQLSVFATTNGQDDGKDEGDEKSTFKFSNSEPIFNTSGSKITPELEVWIADIGTFDASGNFVSDTPDGLSELFATGAKRVANGTFVEDYFFVAFTYQPDDLVPIYDAVFMSQTSPGPGSTGFNDFRPGIPGITDFDGDGKAEIYLKNRIYAAETGFLLADGGGDWISQVNSAPVAANIIKSSNSLELICGTLIYDISSVNFTNRTPGAPTALTPTLDMNAPAVTKLQSPGQPAWTSAHPRIYPDPSQAGGSGNKPPPQNTNYSSTSVADVNNDGTLDVFISGALDNPNGFTAVFYWDIVASSATAYEPIDPDDLTNWAWGTGIVNLKDLDGDAKVEANFVAGDHLFALEESGGLLIEMWTSDLKDALSGIVATTVYDFENDGRPEIVVRDSKELRMHDGLTGVLVNSPPACESHTLTEGPIVVDINGDGDTDICISCFTGPGKFKPADNAQAKLGGINLFNSTTSNWLPTRKVWNQGPYFVVNIRDDLSVPFPMGDQTTIFGTGACDNGLPGPQKPLNMFLNQIPTLGPGGCPIYPAPDIAFGGIDPRDPAYDPNLMPGDPGYIPPTIEVIPPVCGELEITVNFNITNDGSLIITDDIPVSFWAVDPTDPSVTAADRLHTEILSVVNFQIGEIINFSNIVFNSTGEAFTLYIVLNDEYATTNQADLPPFLPLTLDDPTIQECDINNNIYDFPIVPQPFVVQTTSTPNVQCDSTDPNEPENGTITAVVFEGGAETLDYGKFGFQWYTGNDTLPANAIPAPEGTKRLLEGDFSPDPGVADGLYTLVVTNLGLGCKSLPLTDTVALDDLKPDITLNLVSHQTQCERPPDKSADGAIDAVITGGPLGAIWEFSWVDDNLNPYNITTQNATGLSKGIYILEVTLQGSSCIFNSEPIVVEGPEIPDPVAITVADANDCSTPNGQVTAQALISGVPQDTLNYDFIWRESDVNFITNGTLLDPVAKNPTRKGLDPGYYVVQVVDKNTGCESAWAITEVGNQIKIPVLTLTELAPQTSCDPLNPNGRIQVDVLIDGIPQNPADLLIEWFRGDNTIPPLHANTSGVNGEIAEGVDALVEFTVLVTSAQNCEVTDKLQITESKPVFAITTITMTPNSTCDPALASSPFTGALTVDEITIDGVPTTDYTGLTFTWYEGNNIATATEIIGETTSSITQREDMDYLVLVTQDNTACVSPDVLNTITAIEDLPVILITETPETTCSGTPNGIMVGAVDVGGVPVTAGYTYEWFAGDDVGDPPVAVTSGPENQDAIELDGGQMYTVRVTNNTTGCSDIRTEFLDDISSNPVITLTPTDNTVCDPGIGFTGAMTAVVTDPNGSGDYINDYTFTWYQGAGAIPGNEVVDPDPLTPLILEGRDGNFYTLVVSNDVLGCTSIPVIDEVKDVPPVIDIVITENTASTNCAGTPNGILAGAVDNGGGPVTAGYTFEWYVGVDANPATGTLIGMTAPGEPWKGIELQGGIGQNYTVRVVEDGSGCENTFTEILNDASELPIVTIVTTENIGCAPGLYTGTATATIMHKGIDVTASPDYTFAWTGPSAYSSTTPITVTGLESGNYTLTVTNTVLSCVSLPGVATVVDNPAVITIGDTNTPSTNCIPDTDPNGQIIADTWVDLDGDAIRDVGIEDLPGLFTYQWHTGVDTSTPIVGETSPTISSIQGGVGRNYTIEVTHTASGCTQTYTVLLNDASELPIVTIVTTENAGCAPGLYTGTATATIMYKGVDVTASPDYTFAWTGPSAYSSTTPVTVTGLESGNYTLTVTNTVLSCVSLPTVATVIDNPAVITIGDTNMPSTNCIPDTDPNGQIIADTWVDLDGDAIRDVGIEDLPGLFTYQWHTGVDTSSPIVGETSPTISSIQGGVGRNYTMEVTHTASGCTQTYTVLLNDASELPIVTIVTTENAGCAPGLYTGTATATIMYKGVDVTASPDYTFAWTGPSAYSSTTPVTVTGLESGNYTLTVTNTVLSCVSLPGVATVVDNPAVITIGDTNTPSTNCIPDTDPNGQIIADTWVDLDGDAIRDVGIEDLPGLFTYQWHTGVDTSTPIVGETSPTISSIQGGAGRNYTMEVTHTASGCTQTYTVLLNDASELPIVTIVTTENAGCAPGLYTGTATATIMYKGVDVTASPDYTFAWTGPSAYFSTTPITITGLESGNYTLTVTNTVLSCVSLPTVATVIDNPAVITIGDTNTPSTNCIPDTDPNGQIIADTWVDLDGDAIRDVGIEDLPGLFTYQWHTGVDTSTPIVGETNPTISSIQGGAGRNYTMEVTHTASGCTQTYTVLLNDASELPIVTIVTTENAGCAPGLYTGTATATIMYKGVDVTASPDYTFAWTGPSAYFSTTPITITGLESGNYTLTVTNTVLSCVSLPTVATVIDNPAVITIGDTNTPSTNCIPDTDPNGQIIADTWVDLDGDAIRDVGIEDLPGLFTYQWHTGVDTSTPIVGETNPTISSIQGGAGRNYTMEVTHTASGCTQTYTVLLNDASELPIVTIVTTENAGCAPGLYTGTATATIMYKGVDVTASPDYTFAWTGPSAYFSTTPITITGLESGNYTLTVTNTVLSCVSLPTVATVIDNPAVITIGDTNTPSTNCIPDTDPNGQIIADTWVDLDGDAIRDVGIEDLPGLFTYQWHTGVDTSTPIVGETSPTISNIQGGVGRNYTIEVTHTASGCTQTYTVLLNDVSELPVVTLTPTDNKGCTAGNFTGTVTATVFYMGIDVTASGDYSFAWISSDIGFVSVDAATITSLKGSETYTLTATNTVLSCIALPVTATVDDNPDPITIFYTNTLNTSCDVTGNGEIVAGIDLNSDLFFDVGIEDDLANLGDYNFTWHVGNTTTGIPPASIPTANHIDQLDGNEFFTIEVERISTGCINTYSEWVQKVITLPDITVTATDFGNTCSTDVFVDVVINNLALFAPLNDPVADFTYTWYRGTSVATGVLIPTPVIVLNGSSDGVILDEISAGTELYADDYTVVVQHSNSTCTAPEEYDRLDEPVRLFDITPTLTNAATNCGTLEGEAFVTITANGSGYPITGPGTYTYTWWEGAPTNTSPVRYFDYVGPGYVQTDNVTSASFYTDPVVDFSLVDPGELNPAVIAGGEPNPDATLSGVRDGIYTVIVTDGNGCKEYITFQIPFAQAQQSNVITVTPDTDCLVNNSSIQVLVVPDPLDVTNPLATDYDIYLFSGSSPVLPAPPAIPNPVDYLETQPGLVGGNTFPAVPGTLAPGVYSVVSQGQNGSRCFSVPTVITIEQWAYDPSVSLVGSIIPNTSCDLPGTPDGSLTINIQHHPDEEFDLAAVPPILETTYDILAVPTDVAYPNIVLGPGLMVGNRTLTNLGPTDYTITVTSSRGCFTTQIYTVPDQPVVSEVTLSTTVNSLTCVPVDGSMEVDQITQVGSGLPLSRSDFHFYWYFDVNGNGVFDDALVYDEDGEENDLNPDLGEKFDNSDVGFAGPGTYWVEIRALPSAGLGLNCPSAPEMFILEDLTVDPIFVYDVTANTSCVGGPDGTIYLDPDRNGAVPPFGLNDWVIDFTSVPVGSGLGLGNILANEGDVFTATGQPDGTYDFTITDNATGCFVTGSLEIATNPIPTILDNLDFTVVDQLTCTPDGSITINQVISAVSGIPGNPATDPSTAVDAVMSNYDFTWYFDANGNGVLDDPATRSNIVGGAPNFGDIYQVPDVGFAGAGIYWVEITKIAGSGGIGCTSSPYKFEILDQSVNPTFVYDVTANTSCNPLSPDGTLYIDPDRNGAVPPFGLNDWVIDFTSVPVGSGLGLGNILANEGDVFTATGQPDGTYDFTITDNATGCFVTGSLEIATNPIPTILDNLDFTVVDQLTCTPDGSITINQVISAVSGIPGNPATDPSTAVDAVMSNYDFTWYFDANGNGVLDDPATRSNIVGGAPNFGDIYQVPDVGFAGAGIYWVEITKIAGSGGIGCTSSPYKFEILDQSVNPTFVYDVTANTSCNPLSPDGTLYIDPDRNGAVPPFGLNDWVIDFTSVPVGSGLGLGNILANEGDVFTATGQPDGTYDFTITDNATGCFVTGSLEIATNPIPTILDNLDFTVVDQLTCTPDGSITINQVISAVSGIPGNPATDPSTAVDAVMSNYDFTWYFDANGNGVLDDPATRSNIVGGAPNFGDIYQVPDVGFAGAGIYWVEITKIAGSGGIGCTSSPYKFEILDQSVNPTFVYDVTANTSCNPLSPDGTLYIDPDRNGAVPPFGLNDWVIDFTSVPVGSGLGLGNILANEGDVFTATGQPDGTYDFTITDNATGCFVTGSLEIATNPIPTILDNLDFTVVDQLTCTPDGSITINQVISAVSGIPGNPATDPSTAVDAVMSNYDFTWYFDANGNGVLDDPATRSNIVGGAPNFGDIYQVPDVGFAGAGIYWVEITKIVGTAGVGCTSSPYKFEILDQSVNPTFVYDVTANTSCDPLILDGTLYIDPDRNGAVPPFGLNDWVIDFTSVPVGSGLGLGNILANEGDVFTATGQPNGTYDFTITDNATGCSIAGSLEIANNPVPPILNNLDFAVVDQFTCTPEGSITITQIETVVSGIPGNPATDPTSAMDVVMSNYDFTWYFDANGNGLLDDPATRSNIVGGAPTFGDIYQVPDVGFAGAGIYWVEITKIVGTAGVGCTSSPYKFEILDQSVNPTFVYDVTANTSCDPLILDGTLYIDPDRNGAVPPFGLNDWVIDFTSVPVGSGLGLGNILANEGDVFTATGQPNGTYDFTITDNATGCSIAGSLEIANNPVPPILNNLDFAVVDQFTCTPEGSITITQIETVVSGIPGNPATDPTSAMDAMMSNYDFTWYFDANGNGLLDDPATRSNIVGGAPNFGDIYQVPDAGFAGAGIYWVEITKIVGTAGVGCTSSPYKFEILDQSVNPTFVYDVTANTSCNPLSPDGTLYIDPDRNGAVPPFGLNDWVIDFTTVPVGSGLGLGNILANEGDVFTATGQPDGTYDYTITDDATGCSVSGSLVIATNPIPSVISSADITVLDQINCTPDGSIAINSVETIVSGLPGPPTTDPITTSDANLSNYTFTWYRDIVDPANIVFGPQVGGIDPLVDGNFMNVNTYIPIAGEDFGAGTYFVEFTKIAINPGEGGLGCSSAPFRVDILDISENPVITWNQSANTACDLTRANGELTAAVTINGNSLSPGSTFSWFVGPDIASPPFVDGVDGNLDQSFVSQETLRDIIPGVYTVLVFDATTGCQITASFEVEDLPTIPNINLDNVTPADQDICLPSGSIAISDGDISIGGIPGLVKDFLFTWTLDSPGNPPLDSLGTDGLPSGLPIIGPIINASIYEFMAAGEYYVTIAPKAGEGAGCPGPPRRIIVDDISTDPQIDFVTTPNSACPGGTPNGVIVATVQEVDGTTTDPYTYTWTVGGGPLASTDAGNTSTIINAVDGDYSLTVLNPNTGCSFIRGFNLILDRTLSEPNIIRVDKIDPIDCNPTARIEVVEIQLGGQPANVGDFEYRWYADDFDPANIILTDPLDPLSPPVSTPNLENVAIGKYFVTALELNTNCESLAKEVNILEDNIIFPTVEIIQDSPQTSCDPAMPNGQLSALADGAFDDSNSGGNYTFTWFDDTSTQIGIGSTIADLGVGLYTVEVRNNITGCSATTAFIVEDGTELSRLQVSLSTEPVTFCDTNNGVAEARIANHNIGNWEFTWSGPNGFSAIEAGNTSRLDNVEPGTYTVSAIDLDGNYCPSLVKTIVVEDQRVPPPIDMIVDSQLTNCYVDQPNGQITATAGGTISGFEFNWYSGISTAGSIIETNNIISGLPIGPYTVEIIDRFTKCSVSDFREIEDDTVLPPSPGAEVLNNLTDCLNPDGALEIVYDGNPIDYDFFWYDGDTPTGTPANTETTYSDLDLGDYTTTVMDLTTGCVSEGFTVTIEDERVFPEFETIVTNANCETSNGIVELQFETDYGVREVLWYDETGFNVGAGQILLDQPTGDYTFEIETFKNCEAAGAETIGTEITNYNGISANNDGSNDGFQIDCITLFPNNNVKIFNRAGVKVYEADGYNNDDIIFEGLGLEGIYLAGQDLPDGTYFYVIDKGDGSRPVTGYLELIR